MEGDNAKTKKMQNVEINQDTPLKPTVGQPHKNSTGKNPRNGKINLLSGTFCIKCGGHNHNSRECEVIITKCAKCDGTKHNESGHEVIENIFKAGNPILHLAKPKGGNLTRKLLWAL